MIIYTKLSNYLKAKNIRYIDLQQDLGISPTTIAKIKKNRVVTTETIDKICAYLDIQPADMMEWVDDNLVK